MCNQLINEAKTDELQKNTKLFKIFLQSTDDSRNWRDMFSFVRSKNYFLRLATFWCHWAERFEMEQMVKDADRLIN